MKTDALQDYQVEPLDTHSHWKNSQITWKTVGALIRWILNTLLHITANILMDAFMHIFWNLIFSLIQCQRIELLSSLVYSTLSSREGQTAHPTCKFQRWNTLWTMRRKNFKTSNLSLDLLRILELHQDFTTPWKCACVTAKILHCEKCVLWFLHQTGGSSHSHSTHRCCAAVHDGSPACWPGFHWC